MLRLNKKQKQEYYDRAKLEMLNKIKVDWPLYIYKMEGNDYFCNKCNAPFTGIPNKYGYVDSPTCPIHGKGIIIYTHEAKSYFHYEDRGDGEFWIYRLQNYLNKKELKQDVIIQGILFYLKEDAFYLEEKDGEIKRGPLTNMLSNLYYSKNRPNNLDEMLDNDSFLKDSGVLRYYFHERNKKFDMEKEKIRLKKKLKQHGDEVMKDLVSVMEFAKKKHQRIPAIEKEGYESLHEYMLDQGMFQTVKNIVIKRIPFDGVNPDAERIEDVLSDEAILMEKISDISEFSSKGDISKLKSTFLSAKNKSAFLEMMNSPILKNDKNRLRKTNNNQPYTKSTGRRDLLSGYHELMLFGYETEALWRYIQKMELVGGLNPNETALELRDYCKLMFMYSMLTKGLEIDSIDDLDVKKAGFNAYPENLLTDTSALKKRHYNMGKRSSEAIFKINFFLMEDFGYSKGDLEIVRIEDFEDAVEMIQGYGGTPLSIDRDGRFDMYNYYLINKVSATETTRIRVVKVNNRNAVSSVFNTSETPFGKKINYDNRGWVSRKINSWINNKNMFLTAKL